MVDAIDAMFGPFSQQGQSSSKSHLFFSFRSPPSASQDHITLEDYEIHDGMGLEMYYN